VSGFWKNLFTSKPSQRDAQKDDAKICKPPLKRAKEQNAALSPRPMGFIWCRLSTNRELHKGHSDRDDYAAN